MEEELARHDDSAGQYKSHDLQKLLQDQSMRASISECGYACIMIGTGEAYLLPFALFLQASNLQIALISSLPILLGAISQLFGVIGSEHFSSRLRFITMCVTVQASVWLPISLVYYLLGPCSGSVWALITLASVYFIAGNLGAPAWNSLIGDITPTEARGRFFGLRNERGAVMTLLAMLGAGVTLEMASSYGNRSVGFFLLFCAAFLSRMASRPHLLKHRDPAYKVTPQSRFSYFQFLKKTPRSNFAKFVLFHSGITFGTMIGGPFFGVYMLNVLHLSYFTYTCLSAIVLLVMFLTNRYWGRLADRYGNKCILSLCSYGVALSALLWLVSSNVWYLFVIQAYSGLVWGGYNLAVGNFLFDSVSPEKRARCVAYQAITSASFSFIGTILGAYLATNLPDWLPMDLGLWTPSSPLLRLFLISGLIRFMACGIMLPRFREVRNIRSIHQSELFFQFLQLLPVVGATIDFFVQRRTHKTR